ncbi:MAG: hypothetical protein R2708_09450 [Vicinamibacterales bacterium]
MGPGGTNAREWTAILERPGEAERHRLGDRDRSALPHAAFDPNAPAWGINFQRTVRRKNEELLWTGHQRNQGLRRMANAGLLLGLTDVTQGLGLELALRVSAICPTRPAHPGRGPERRGQHRRRRHLQLHPEPARRGHHQHPTSPETEVDQRLVNLTRFPLFLPERRTFFLDGATFFDFANRAFFSRFASGSTAAGSPSASTSAAR